MIRVVFKFRVSSKLKILSFVIFLLATSKQSYSNCQDLYAKLVNPQIRASLKSLSNELINTKQASLTSSPENIHTLVGQKISQISDQELKSIFEEMIERSLKEQGYLPGFSPKEGLKTFQELVDDLIDFKSPTTGQQFANYFGNSGGGLRSMIVLHQMDFDDLGKLNVEQLRETIDYSQQFWVQEHFKRRVLSGRWSAFSTAEDNLKYREIFNNPQSTKWVQEALIKEPRLKEYN